MSKDTYYKRKTKVWLEDLGYQAEYLEKLQRIYDKKKNSILFIKRDLFGADLLAINEEEIIFANAILGSKNIAEHIKRFKKYKFPRCKHIKVWLIKWEKRIKEPEIIDCNQVKEKNMKEGKNYDI